MVKRGTSMSQKPTMQEIRLTVKRTEEMVKTASIPIREKK
jgi:hypothetical protein